MSRVKFCRHYVKSYFDTSDRSKPTKEEINKSRLYQCKQCKKWFSFWNHTKKNQEPKP